MKKVVFTFLVLMMGFSQSSHAQSNCPSDLTDFTKKVFDYLKENTDNNCEMTLADPFYAGTVKQKSSASSNMRTCNQSLLMTIDSNCSGMQKEFSIGWRIINPCSGIAVLNGKEIIPTQDYFPNDFASKCSLQNFLYVNNTSSDSNPWFKWALEQAKTSANWLDNN